MCRLSLSVKHCIERAKCKKLFAFKVQFSNFTFLKGKYNESSNFDVRCCLNSRNAKIMV